MSVTLIHIGPALDNASLASSYRSLAFKSLSSSGGAVLLVPPIRWFKLDIFYLVPTQAKDASPKYLFILCFGLLVVLIYVYG